MDSDSEVGAMRRPAFANVIAVVALFIALGGTAWALANDSVRSRHIVDDQVKSADLQDDGVKSADLKDDGVKSAHLRDDDVRSEDVEDETLTGDDIADDTLTQDDVAIEDFSFSAIPATGVLSSQAQSIGGDGDTTFGPISGRTPASPSMADVQMALPSPTLFGVLAVFVSEPLATGEFRTFTLVLRPRPSGPTTDSDISCTITGGEDYCSDHGPDGSGALMAAIRIESSSFVPDALNPNDDAYIALGAKGDYP